MTDMPYRILGRTGERVSAIGLGGWHIGLKTTPEELSIRIIRSAIDRGVNFLDNSWDYNEGASELRMGKALRDGYRSKVFPLLAKTAKAAARGQFELFKTSSIFDSTTTNPEWLGKEPDRLRRLMPA